jgi:two-component system chemotaxis response regulator CheB
MSARPVRVLIIDDSALVRRVLNEGLSQDPEIEVIGVATNPYAARDILVRERPDVITLDIEMPRMDGLTFLKKYMAVMPTPTIILSSLTQTGKKITIEALEAGAVHVVAKPVVGLSDFLPEILSDLREKIKQAAQVPVARYARRMQTDSTPEQARPLLVETRKSLEESTDQVIALGASTGGVEAVARILPLFPPVTPGIVIVEHMPAGFTASFAERLNTISQITVKEAEEGDRIRPGLALLAPGGDRHLSVRRSGGQYLIHLIDGEKVSGHRPSVDVCFESLAQEVGKNAVGVLMTGMGSDGARGLLKMRQAGARTFVQNAETCVVYGMPDVAMKMGAAEKALALMDIPATVLKALNF